LTNNNCAPGHTGQNDGGLDEPSASERPLVSVVMPARDEELTIGECIAGIQALFARNNIKGEIIVSDSSTDRTAEIASALGATVVHPAKLGYGFAYLEGFRHVKSNSIVMMDADGTYDPSDIIKTPDFQLSFGSDLNKTIAGFQEVFPDESEEIKKYFHTVFEPENNFFTRIRSSISSPTFTTFIGL